MQVAEYIKQCKTPEEIRLRFNIPNDFTPEEVILHSYDYLCPGVLSVDSMLHHLCFFIYPKRCSMGGAARPTAPRRRRRGGVHSYSWIL